MTHPAAQKCLALVLRTVDFSETSRIVTLLTRELGRVEALAKGARRLRSATACSLELLSLSRIVVLVRSADVLDLVVEAELVDSFPRVRQDLSALYAGLYMAEIIAGLTSNHDPQEELFEAARGLLERLGPGSPPELLFAFELACLERLGYGPALDRCGLCQAPLESSRRVYFSPAGGGAVCGRCRPPGQVAVGFSAAAREAMIRLAAGSWDAAAASRLAEPTRREVRGLLGHYVSHLMGRRPKTLDWLIQAPRG